LHARTIVALAALALASSAQAALVWTAQATEKIRPAAAARATRDVRIAAAGNEFEAFQVAITGAATNVHASASALTGPGGTIPVRLFREDLITLRNPSALDGATGAWPDALVPATDELAGEVRNAFPFSVPSGETRAVWAEVHVPPAAPAGSYAGEVVLSWDGGEAKVPVTLTVWPFSLPSTASLKSAFGLYYGALGSAHGVSGDGLSALRARYGDLALDHRVTLSKIDDNQPDLGHFTSFFGAQIDGAARTMLAGARMTAVEFVGRSAYGPWASWFDAQGWGDRLFQYTCDEPPLTCAWADIPARAQIARTATPPLRTLVTTTIHESNAHGVTDSIDIMVPAINFMDDRPGSRFAGNQRASYDAFLAGSPGRELWLYQSCMSHGCGGTVNMGTPSEYDVYSTGWPSYMIDASAPRNRAMQWLAFKYDATGELYYEVAMAYPHDPWTNQWDFSGNGDGTLFYPGTPAKIGGTSHVPVASIRLKMIREGMEDYEYLRMLADAGDAKFARDVADALFPNAYSTEVSPDALMAAREKLAQRILAKGLAGTEPGSEPAPGPAPGPGPSPSDPGARGAAGSAVGSGGCASGGVAGLLALFGLAGLARRRRR